MNHTDEIATHIAHAPAVAGSTDITDCKVIDMANWESVRFIVSFGTLTSGAVTGLRVQQSDVKASATALTSGADLEGTALVVPDTASDKLFVIEINKPRERYVQLVIDRATQNAVLNLAVAEQFGTRKLPITQDADVSAYEIHASPAEGTA